MTLEMTCIQKLTSNTGLSCVSVVLLNFPVFTSSHIDVPVWHAVDSFAPFCLPACLVHRARQSLQAYNILQGNCAQFSTTIFGHDGGGGWGGLSPPAVHVLSAGQVLACSTSVSRMESRTTLGLHRGQLRSSLDDDGKAPYGQD